MAVLDAVTISTADLEGAGRFYDAVLAALGWVRVAELVDEEENDAVVEALGWGSENGPAEIWLVRGTTPTVGLHLRLQVKAQVEVETFAAAAVQAGGLVVSAPRRWTVYRRGEFGAAVADPAGNLLEVVAPEDVGMPASRAGFTSVT